MEIIIALTRFINSYFIDVSSAETLEIKKNTIFTIVLYGRYRLLIYYKKMSKVCFYHTSGQVAVAAYLNCTDYTALSLPLSLSLKPSYNSER